MGLSWKFEVADLSIKGLTPEKKIADISRKI
jgi:hypothetical protein